MDRSEYQMGLTTVADPQGQDPGDAGLFFALRTTTARAAAGYLASGITPTPRHLPRPSENRFGEQFVFTLARVTRSGTVASGNLG